IDRADSASSLPAEGDDGRDSPQPLGQHYIWIDPTAGSNNAPDLWVKFDGEVDGEWTAWIVGTYRDKVGDSVQIPLVDELVEARFPNMVDYDDIYLVVSPRSDAQAEWSYSWEA